MACRELKMMKAPPQRERDRFRPSPVANNVRGPDFPFPPNPWSGVIPPVVTNDFFVFK
jgi:hypothetical protein